MRCIVLVIGVAMGLWALLSPFVHSQSEPAKDAPAAQADDKTAQPEGDRSVDEAAIRANVDNFVKAYNAHDAKGVAALFLPGGETIDKDGDMVKGREAIAKTFDDLFKATPDKRIDVSIESIRFLSPDLAVETGQTKETEGPNETPDYDRYTVVHVKRDGKWQMAMARDEEEPAPVGRDQLQPLAWLIGEWVDDDGNSVVRSKCRWSDDGKFLLQEFKLQLAGQDAMNVSQRIGWDPVQKQIRSWVFDSEGGFGESLWSRDGDNWVIRATGVRPDGTTGSATNFLIPAGNDGYIWRTTDRIVAGERQPNMEVKVVRKAPEPKK
jgi:uncharacterized protein (TIGR02246 family)